MTSFFNFEGPNGRNNGNFSPEAKKAWKKDSNRQSGITVKSLYIKYSLNLSQGVHVAIHVINSDTDEPTHVPHYNTRRIIYEITGLLFCFGLFDEMGLIRSALRISQHRANPNYLFRCSEFEFGGSRLDSSLLHLYVNYPTSDSP